MFDVRECRAVYEAADEAVLNAAFDVALHLVRHVAMHSKGVHLSCPGAGQ